MQFGQAVRQAGHGLGRAFGWAGRRLKLNPRAFGVRGILRALGVLIVVVGLYYVIGSIITSNVDQNLNFKPPAADEVKGGAESVAMAAALIDREVNKNGWVPDDPIYKPTILQDNMPNFQEGMVAAIARFAIELTDQLGRSRGSSEVDKDLQQASGLLRYPPNRWIWTPSENWFFFTQSSEDAYRRAAKALKAYNVRLAKGDAIFERRADNLQATLIRIAADLGSTSATIDEFVATRAGFPWDNKVDDLFYRDKGQLYAYYMILKELRVDFDGILKERNLYTVYDQMLDSLAKAVKVQPFCVLNASPDSDLFPNHVLMQGFYLLRARTRLREITQILQT
jgi:hypothetical protein